MTQTDQNDSPHLPALLTGREEYQARLAVILPPSVTGTTDSANPGAGALAFTMMYVGAIGDVHPIRPSTAYWMGESLAMRREDSIRTGYYLAAMRSEKAVLQFCQSMGFERGETWYAQHTREPLRDQTLRSWMDHGVVRVDESVKTTSPKARYTFAPEFAKLLDPALVGEELNEAIKAWQNEAFGPVALSRVDEVRRKAKGEAGVSVHLPDGTVRQLSTGESSWILKGVIEKFCPRVMLEPRVLFISQSEEKARPEDIAFLKKIKMPLDAAKLLPDCLIVDLAKERGHFWFIEAVATDGPITEARKKEFIKWASKGGLPIDKCRFLTAFEGRGYGPAKVALPKLANHSHSWYLDEPAMVLTWDSLPDSPESPPSA
ncbi:BsuBI/PstI family type II restriction endonuclease [Actinacidiphila guanduensis]|uniref:BsuBI/PstI restriction endonuclease C-terminus n=1 Tax=Actinacidiphila guanduensis TaxID=310781 RepID=A0A1G9YMB4_9ACTN|nr:BsuBI/PstI family type II restriction endonuclease [Actinacidiphila guanduensis]SDN09685.1 BsuBI/PstI restriction endonuclease C-terminus [Actinacidiphila guanduensis]